MSERSPIPVRADLGGPKGARGQVLPKTLDASSKQSEEDCQKANDEPAKLPDRMDRSALFFSRQYLADNEPATDGVVRIEQPFGIADNLGTLRVIACVKGSFLTRPITHGAAVAVFEHVDLGEAVAYRHMD